MTAHHSAWRGIVTVSSQPHAFWLVCSLSITARVVGACVVPDAVRVDKSVLAVRKVAAFIR